MRFGDEEFLEAWSAVRPADPEPAPSGLYDYTAYTNSAAAAPGTSVVWNYSANAGATALAASFAADRILTDATSASGSKTPVPSTPEYGPIGGTTPPYMPQNFVATSVQASQAQTQASTVPQAQAAQAPQTYYSPSSPTYAPSSPPYAPTTPPM